MRSESNQSISVRSSIFSSSIAMRVWKWSEQVKQVHFGHENYAQKNFSFGKINRNQRISVKNYDFTMSMCVARRGS